MSWWSCACRYGVSTAREKLLGGGALSHSSLGLVGTPSNARQDPATISTSLDLILSIVPIVSCYNVNRRYYEQSIYVSLSIVSQMNQIKLFVPLQMTENQHSLFPQGT